MPRAVDGQKICSKCRIQKPVEEFGLHHRKSDGLRSQCRRCRATDSAKYYCTHKTQTIVRVVATQTKRKIANSLFRFERDIHALIKRSLRGNGTRRNSKTAMILGVSPIEFQAYLSAQFKDGWTIADHGIKWDLDHIVPVSSAKTEEDVIRLNHYSNFQPLECSVNRYVKRNKKNWKPS